MLKKGCLIYLKIRRGNLFMKTAGRLQTSFPSGLTYTNCEQVQSLPKVNECFNGGNTIMSLSGDTA